MPTLIYHTGALGDFITTIPAIQYYKRQNPGHLITLLGKPAMGKFAKDIGLIDNWLDVDNPNFLPLFYDDFSGEAQNLLSAFSTAVLFTVADSPVIKNSKQSTITRIFQQSPFPSSPMHVIDYHLSLFCHPESLEWAEKSPHIVPTAEAFASLKEMFPADKPRPAAIHPGSGSGKKNWPFARFIQVAEFFQSQKIPVLWIKGPAEDHIDFPSDAKVVSNLSFAELAALLSQCRAFIGNDSGVTHLAAATGCKTVGLFGPSDPRIWAPRGRDVTIFSHDISCAPCHRRQSTDASMDTPCDNSCLNDISVNEVFYIFS